MQQTLLITLLVYLIGFPLGFRLFGFAEGRLKQWNFSRKLQKGRGGRAALMKNAPEPAYPRWKGRLKFTWKDKRAFTIGGGKDKQPKVLPFKRNQVYWGFKALGFLVALGGALVGQPWKALLVAAVLYIWGLIYGYRSANPVLTQREAVVKKMFAIAKSRLGQSAEYEANPGQVIRVLEWRDYVKPEKVEFDIPETFSEDGIEGFMKLFNQNHGKETAFVAADNEETGDPGWDFDKGVATLKAVPPLPRRADWSEHYVLGEGVAWSFFPIGLGVEHGLELTNPNTGQVENVLGFDVSGEQAKLAAKLGIKMSPTITVSPMSLVGGGTGSGKALSVDTMVDVISEEEESNHEDHRGPHH